MNLYLISQTENDGYDTFDSAVVAAQSADDAVRIHPRDNGREYSLHTWAGSFEGVHCELIGVAKEGTEAGVILASFNAG